MRWKVRCRRCDRIVRPPLGAGSYFHRCEPTRRVVGLGELEERGLTVDERRAAAWSWLGGAK